MHVANVGDSKALRITSGSDDKWSGQVLTATHKPDLEAESARITKAGGYILKEDDLGAARVFDHPDPIGQMLAISMASGGGVGAVGGMVPGAAGVGGMGGFGTGRLIEPWPGLAMSRVLGHKGVAALGIIPDPDVSSFELTASDRALVLASDGVWDFVTDAEAAEVCQKFAKNVDATGACKAIVSMANARWEADDPLYRDDISCCVVYTPLDVTDATKIAISGKSLTYTADDANVKVEVDADDKDASTTAPSVPSGGDPGRA